MLKFNSGHIRSQNLSVFNELKRRNVFRVGIAYIVVAWLVAQVLQLVFESFGTPGWVIKTVLVLLATGLPIALIFAWAFEMTPDGIKREKDVDRNQSVTKQTGRKLDLTIIGVLVLVAAYFVWESRFSERGPELNTQEPTAQIAQVSNEQREPTTAIAQENSIAVLPFANRSRDKDDEFFSD